MIPDLVVDVGNTRIKWGLCRGGQVVAAASLPPDAPTTWTEQVAAWSLQGQLSWALSAVHPGRCEALAAWLRERGHRVAIVEDWRLLPLDVPLEYPGRVGIDRLLDAVAANSRRPEGVPAILIDAGSAVTVDWVDEQGAFQGGAIFPGLRLMARALHDYTALLPLVEVHDALPALPATSTPAAMEAGIACAVAGGIRCAIERLSQAARVPPQLWLTGGDAPVLAPALGPAVQTWPLMTLEGLRLAAASLP